ncbi:MAG: hypothetical protein WC877_03330 [Dehalococcoidales bacterium]
METISNQNQPVATVADAVCPHCFKLLSDPAVIDEDIDSYKRRLRMYLGHCPECSAGFEVIQFQRDQRWVLHRYRDYLQHKAGQWITLNELPLPAPVVTGPGGDYMKYHELQLVTLKNVIETLEKAKQALIAILQ